ncbi:MULTISPECIES: (2Fe-2S)-binding protein [Silvimonas]|uniref:(2Fe-2S)-binding protein n=1 Tax=Silvimonas TaxID=300264 RepID=UPI0024B347C5|nr:MULTISPECIES: (2Fe-2S)-binding protein [Silvimonas]MDR3428576.1 (2Fe-2S)-binding protein [Silvimonas sp.]
MYVCICNGVTEKAIHVAVEKGARTFTQLQMATGAGTCCGQCTTCAKDTMMDAIEAEAIRGWEEMDAVAA